MILLQLYGKENADRKVQLTIEAQATIATIPDDTYTDVPKTRLFWLKYIIMVIIKPNTNVADYSVERG